MKKRSFLSRKAATAAIIRPTLLCESGNFAEDSDMAEKVQKLGLERDYKQYLYFINKQGNVARKKKGGDAGEEVVAETHLQREKGYLYFIDKEGDLARAPRKGKSDSSEAEHAVQ
jgi:hypothetical protein